MRIDHEYEIEQIHRDNQIKNSEKERELLIIKSEVIRAQEQVEDQVNIQKKLQIKFDKEALDYQLQIKTLTKINDELKDEIQEISLLEAKLEERDTQIEALSEEIDDLKEQLLMHKLRLVPSTQAGDSSQSGSSIEHELVRLTQHNRSLQAEIGQLKRKIDDQNFKAQSNIIQL